MKLNNYYWYFQSVLSDKFCNDLVKHAKSKKEKLGTVGDFLKKEKLSKKETLDLKKKRDSNIVFLNDTWIYNEIFPYIRAANINAGWNFQFDHAEDAQFTKYSKGQHYDWHCDTFDSPYISEDSNYSGKIRKLSVTCSLSDPKDYEGGELEFQFRDGIDANEARVCKQVSPKGSIVVFPSHVWHRVRPVTKGTRYSLVIWNLGYPFK
jgi:PKHD-type hydroxylase